MTDVCYTCGRPMAEIDADVKMLNTQLEVWNLANLNVGGSYTVGGYGLLKGERFTLLQKQTYAEERNGSTTDCFVVFRREKTGKVYKKLAQGDSYGEIEWDGALYEVKVVKKMVETWEVSEEN